MTPVPTLTPAQLDAIGAEFDAIRDETRADLGERDARHIRRVVRVGRASAITGRLLLALGFDPFTWVLGVGALSLAKILDNMEVGHNVMHGQYDWMNDPALQSQTFEWDNVCDASQWRNYHNYEHHTYCNILGKDRDVGYGFLRVTEGQRWHPVHLFQPITNVVLCLLFEWGVGVHDLELEHRKGTPEERSRLSTKWKQFRRKAGRQLFKDYVLFPALSLWNAPRVLLGNLVANLVRNVWSNIVIFCGHFPEGVRVYTLEETANESRGGWYVRQLQGSANLEGSRLFYVMTGHLSHQIEHHLFPDLPSHRYPEIAPRVREICKRYGLPYVSGSLRKQYASVLRQQLRLALPGAALPAPQVA